MTAREASSAQDAATTAAAETAPMRPRTATRAMVVTAALTVTIAAVLAFVAPTFDLDEALYRRIAEEMKQSRHFVQQTWDGKPFYEKPPAYIWTIVAADAALDNHSPRIGIFAARVPSFCFSLLTVAVLGLFWRRFGPSCASAFGADPASLPRWLLSPLTPMLAYAAGLLPFAGAVSVLLDPMLTLLLTAPLLVLTGALMKRSTFDLSRRESVVAGLGMAAAVAVKGLVGMIIPAAAIVFHAILGEIGRDDGERHRALPRRAASALGSAVRTTAPSFALAVLFSATFYGCLFGRQGGTFLYEFFVRQHFVRGMSAMQGHGGSVFYHPLVVLIFGGSLVAFVLIAFTAKVRSTIPYVRWGLPLSWTLATVVFYSAMSTKLPNYTWPVWPALSIALCVLLVRSAAAKTPAGAGGRIASVASTLAYASCATLAVGFTAAGAGLEGLFLSGHLSARTLAIVASIEPVPLPVRAALLSVGLAAASQCLLVRAFGRSIRQHGTTAWAAIAGAAVANGITLLAIYLVIVPFADFRMREPLVRLSAAASRKHVAGGDFTTIGLFSPTVSSNYAAGVPQQVGRANAARFAGPGQHLLLVPSWRTETCTSYGFTLLQRDGYVVLCEKNALKATEPSGIAGPAKPLDGS